MDITLRHEKTRECFEHIGTWSPNWVYVEAENCQRIYVGNDTVIELIEDEFKFVLCIREDECVRALYIFNAEMGAGKMVKDDSFNYKEYENIFGLIADVLGPFSSLYQIINRPIINPMMKHTHIFDIVSEVLKSLLSQDDIPTVSLSDLEEEDSDD